MERNFHMPSRNRPDKNQAGVTLVELLIAMAILALGVLAATSIQMGTARNNSKGNIYTQAYMLAIERLEILKNQDVSSLVPGAYSDASQIDANGQPGGIYSRNWTIDNLGTMGRIITVTVQWQRGGKTNRVVLSSNTKGNGV
jgi:prepilin-type N-terminal cleavage/methylation domain-containing protein